MNPGELKGGCVSSLILRNFTRVNSLFPHSASHTKPSVKSGGLLIPALPLIFFSATHCVLKSMFSSFFNIFDFLTHKAVKQFPLTPPPPGELKGGCVSSLILRNFTRSKHKSIAYLCVKRCVETKN